MARITIYIPDEDELSIKIARTLARRQGMSLSSLFVQLIKTWKDTGTIGKTCRHVTCHVCQGKDA